MLLSDMYTITQARIQEAVLSDGTQESEIWKKSIKKTSFKFIALQYRCMGNLQYSSWEPNLFYKFPKETYSRLLSSIKRLSREVRPDRSLFKFYLVQNDAISYTTGHWLPATSTSLWKELTQSRSDVTLPVLHILSATLSLNTPLPHFLTTPGDLSFRAIVQERMPKEIEENDYAVFAALAVSSRLATREIEKCVELVGALVGEVNPKIVK